MQIKLSFKSVENIILPIHHNNIIQAFIYNNIDRDLSRFLHNEGYSSNGRTFKLFTFSRILNRGKIKDGKFHFGKEIEFVVSSPLDNFCNSIANCMLQREDLRLGQNKVSTEGIQVYKEKVRDNEIVVETLSSIVVYSTLFRADGRKYTCYFVPGEEDFKRILSENLIRKYNALYNMDLPLDNEVKIESIGEAKLNITYYKNFLIKGSSGRFKIKGDRKLLQLGLDVGLGSKNSQGFGCVRIVKGRWNNDRGDNTNRQCTIIGRKFIS